jgi:aminoglycoside phosphotransferase family enzyme
MIVKPRARPLIQIKCALEQGHTMNEMKADPGDAAAAGDRQNALIAALCDSARYPHDVGRVRVLETHISWVLLTGRYAYKIKKAVDFGFLDFSTLARRKHCCEEELRLNRRLAPDIYLDVVPIRGSHQAPRFDGDGPVVEYAVRMREFPQGALADALLPRGDFGAREIDLLAVAIARFHGAAAQAGPATGFGAPELVLREALQNFDQISEFGNTPDDQETLENLRAWTMRMHGRLRETMALRLQAGYVRECHGDLHLGNIAVLDGQPVPFDCIEFNPELRWIDVMSELAFLTMDLADRGYPQLAARILNRYLEEGGDYDGVRLFDFFQVYRALVRAKVQRLHQGSREAAAGAVDATEWGRYIALSRQLAAPRATFLLITHGLSGCGKSTVSQSLLEGLCAVRVRSDVERKRL